MIWWEYHLWKRSKISERERLLLNSGSLLFGKLYESGIKRHRYRYFELRNIIDTTSGDEDRNIESKNERAEFNETLNAIVQAIVGSDIREETLIVKSEEGLSDSLFSDLKDIDLPTVETQAALESETEPLPEELFDDLEKKYE